MSQTWKVSAHWDHLAFLHFILGFGPNDAVRCETGEPNEKVDGIAEWNKPNPAAKDFITDSPDADNPGHGEPEKEIASEIEGRDSSRRSNENSEDSPRQPLSKKQTEIRNGTTETNGARPAHLMQPKTPPVLRGVHCRNDLSRQDDAASRPEHAATELVIVGELIGEGFKAANFGDPGFCSGNGGAESEPNVFGRGSHEDAGEEVARGADRLHFREKIPFGNGAVKAGDGGVGGISERSDDLAQVIGPDADVAIAQDEDFVFGFTGEKGEIVHLLVGAGAGRAGQNANPAIRETSHDGANEGNGRVRLVVDGKKDFVIGVVLTAEAGEVFERAKIDAVNRFEHADGRSKDGERASAFAEEKARRGEGSSDIVHEGQSSEKKDRIAPNGRMKVDARRNQSNPFPNFPPRAAARKTNSQTICRETQPRSVSEDLSSLCKECRARKSYW